jgi:hypothetical protein
MTDAFSGPCKCGKDCTWKCGQCGAFVCADCTQTIPGRIPSEYYEETLCSIGCWASAGKPEE